MTAVAKQASTAPHHHLSDDLLLDYASGALDEATSLFVASHLTLCPECRAQAERLDMLGGALMDEIEPIAMSAGALDAMMARLDAANDTVDTVTPAAKAVPGIAMPAPLRRYFGSDLDGVEWKKQGGGVSIALVPGLGEGSNAFMLKVEPGRAVPQHTHEGNEYVMVLTGGYQDDGGHFVRGDVEQADGSVDHQPIADMGEDCVCLVVTDGPVRFTGKTGWLLNMFVKM